MLASALGIDKVQVGIVMHTVPARKTKKTLEALGRGESCVLVRVHASSVLGGTKVHAATQLGPLMPRVGDSHPKDFFCTCRDNPA
jgi:hypothetical protein